MINSGLLKRLVLWGSILLTAGLVHGAEQDASFREDFVLELESEWLASIENEGRLTAILKRVEAKFEFEPVPRFPGLSRQLADLGDELYQEDSLGASAKTLSLACIVDDCDLGVELRRMSVALADGDYHAAASHTSTLFQKAWMLPRVVGRPLDTTTLISLSLVFGMTLFWFLVMLKYINGFGVAVKGDSHLLSSWLVGLLPLGLSMGLLWLGYGLTVFLVWGVLLIPIMTNRERWLLVLSAVFLVGTVFIGDIYQGSRARTGSDDVSDRFLGSGRQSALLDSGATRQRLESVLVRQLRFGDADGVLATIGKARRRNTPNIVVEHDEGLLNSEGIAYGIIGQMDSALSRFEASYQFNPGRFESAYNAFTVLKGMGRDKEAQVYLDHSLKLDSKAVGARIAESAVGDIEGFVYLDSTRWWKRDWVRLLSRQAKAASAEVRRLVGGTSIFVYGLFILLVIGLILSSMLERRLKVYFPCPSCGKPTAQTRIAFYESPLLCELCRLDVATASRLPRSELQRHEDRVRRWQRLSKAQTVVAVCFFPIFRYVLTDAPIRGLVLSWLFVFLGIGTLGGLVVAGLDELDFFINASLFGLLHVCMVLGARQRSAE